MGDKFFGYRRENGAVGVRNHIAIIPSVFCASKVAERIAQNVPGAVHFSHPVGCSQVGEEIYQEILAVASGKLCKAEVLGHDEQFCITRLPKHNKNDLACANSFLLSSIHHKYTIS